MQFTPESELPYLDSTDPAASIPDWSQSLAEGIAAPVTFSITPAAGFTLDAQRCWRLFGQAFVWFDVELTRTGGALTMDAGGNITNTLVMTLTGVLEAPPRDSPLHGARQGISRFGMRATSSGEIYLDDGYPTSSLGTGNLLRVFGLVPYI